MINACVEKKSKRSETQLDIAYFSSFVENLHSFYEKMNAFRPHD